MDLKQYRGNFEYYFKGFDFKKYWNQLTGFKITKFDADLLAKYPDYNEKKESLKTFIIRTFESGAIEFFEKLIRYMPVIDAYRDDIEAMKKTNEN